MTTFFCFIVLTLTISFWQYTVQSLPFTIPAWCLGIAVGYWFGVRTEQQKLKMHGIEHYLEHFAHVHMTDITKLNWWSVINFYTIMGGLLLINLVGLSTVIFHNVEYSAIRTTGVGAFLLGTTLPYMIHLWSIKAPHNNNSMASE